MTSYYHLSQGDLSLLETCPPQFEKNYLQNILEPRHLKNQGKTQWGKLFHLLMQQYNLGLNLESISSDNQALINEVKALIEKTKYIWFSSEIIFREAEYQVNYTIDNYLLTVIYDLLVLYPDKAIIIDWKTYRESQNKQKILNNWQTKLYLYVLAQKFNYSPEQIYFDYWFISSPQKIEKYSIAYSNSFHQKIEQDLNIVLDKFDNLITNFYHQNISFPHHDNCRQCPYRDSFNNSVDDNLDRSQILTSLDDIEAIEI